MRRPFSSRQNDPANEIQKETPCKRLSFFRFQTHMGSYIKKKKRPSMSTAQFFAWRFGSGLQCCCFFSSAFIRRPRIHPHNLRFSLLVLLLSVPPPPPKTPALSNSSPHLNASTRWLSLYWCRSQHTIPVIPLPGVIRGVVSDSKPTACMA